MYRIENKAAAIRNVQHLLSQNETGIFDENTRNSVAEHQERYDLNVTGIVDYETFESILRVYKNAKNEEWEDISFLFRPKFPYKIGDRGSNVGYINSILRDIFSDYTLESKLPYGEYYGTDTALAVREIRNILKFSPGDEISTALFKRMLIEREAIKIKKSFN